jgi:hypothetical protein
VFLDILAADPAFGSPPLVAAHASPAIDGGAGP